MNYVSLRQVFREKPGSQGRQPAEGIGADRACFNIEPKKTYFLNSKASPEI